MRGYKKYLKNELDRYISQCNSTTNISLLVSRKRYDELISHNIINNINSTYKGIPIKRY